MLVSSLSAVTLSTKTEVSSPLITLNSPNSKEGGSGEKAYVTSFSKPFFVLNAKVIAVDNLLHSPIVPTKTSNFFQSIRITNLFPNKRFGETSKPNTDTDIRGL